MARIFITGSAGGLGQLTATALVAQRHEVVLHARNERRGQEALDKVPGAETVLTADLGRHLGDKTASCKGECFGKLRRSDS
jgi:NAD(P)-dependent dehydrogenase (short-subunit alcohol dehydrogenase family)